MNKKGFFGSLFDFSFRSFVTTKIVKLLYVLSLIVISLVTIVIIAATFNRSSGFGALMLFIGGPLIFLFWLTYTRIILEVIIVFFRIAESVEAIAQSQSVATTPAAATTPPGWYSDPWGRFTQRWWDGQAWTSRVEHDGTPGEDPPGAR